MLGKVAITSITVVIILVFAGMAFATIFDSNTSLNTSAGYLNATSTGNKPLYILSSPGEIEFSVTVKTTASTVYFFSVGNMTIGNNSKEAGQVVNLTSFRNMSVEYNGKTSNSTNDYNYVTISNYENNSVVHLFLNLSSQVFDNMEVFNPQNVKGTTYIDSILVIGSNDGTSFLGFALGKY